jgi:predicted DNA binding protein
MWVSEIEFDGKLAQIGSRTLKHNVTLFGFPLSYSYEEKYIIVNIAGNIFGDEKTIASFLKDIKKAKRVKHFENNGNFIIGTLLEPKEITPIYSSKILHLAPVQINSKGIEKITIGSFEKRDLIYAIKSLEKIYNINVLYIKNKEIKSISLFKQGIDLTKKQIEAMDLAISKGYYNSPRKVDLVTLSKVAKCSYSTFQVHLRKAESKLMPFYFKK